ncbi:MAG: hydroxyacid dehydrogenase [Candidatus Bathyarchaeota archaeon]|jgi:D-3-phosphoglycerate dehydrogenase|nr:hydroxyacid dehydrogenase [Candidatus Bathyarchaeota archaeon]MDP7442763.1 hydroxyacid dehydrogenase [Candidatus Bathyarchaeota archaeon]|tara:strand:+ start:905 stop:1834 length:930 start_codon:yes stop_codon:yes gene_type:complete
MGGPVILVCDQIHDDGVKVLMEAGYIVDLRTAITASKLIEVVGGFDALVVRSRTKVTRCVLEAGKRLKVIGRAGVGLDNIDLVAAKRLEIIVVNSPEGPSNAVAELVMGLMFSLARRIPEADASMKKGEWIKGRLTGIELKGKTIGIIGFGRIGNQIAKKARALELSVLVYDVSFEKVMQSIDEAGAEAVTLDELLRSSDFITVHVPLLPQTKYMIGADEISTMKDGVYLINAARGGVINEEALKEALLTGKLAGVALDVYEEEPPRDQSLIGLSNVVSLPHIGAATVEAQRTNSIIVAEKLIKILGQD